jgi:UDP-N-acetylglucosamine diphosphorylase/glucosamine-1-phosphate N-acetyltransferase
MKKAVILAAGDSTRMLPLSANKPKHLLPVAGRPLLFHTLEALEQAGIKETLIICGYHAEQLSHAVENESWGSMSISFVHQKDRKGTAHAAGHAREFAGDEELILMNGDVLVGPGSFDGLIKFHRKGKYEATVTVTPIEDPTPYGVVTVKKDRATGLIEKPTQSQLQSNLVNVGIYAVGKSLWEAIDKTQLSPRGEYELTDSVMMLIEKGQVGAYSLPSWWLDVGKPWDLLEANRLILSDLPELIEGDVEAGAVLKNRVVVEKGALVRSGAYIEGPVYIARDAIVGPNCYLRAHTYIGLGARIGNAVEIKNSIIMSHTNVGHLSYVGDSIIGERSNFGAGTITANLRHDDSAIRVTVKGKRIDSGRRKLGAIIGDDVKTGIGTSIGPGVVLHQGCRTGMGVIIDKDIQANRIVLAKQEQIVLDRDLRE